MSSDGQIVQPIYLLADASGGPESSLVDFANKLISKLFREVHSDPILDQRVRLAILELGAKPTTLLRLCQLSNVVQVPGLVSTNGLSLQASFSELREQIDADVSRLKEEGYRVLRPGVFLFIGHLSDDDWRQAYFELTDRTLFRFAPNIFCFGAGHAKADDVLEIASTGLSELNAMAANMLDRSVGDEVLSKNIIEHFIVAMLTEPLRARTVSTSAFRFPTSIPGIIPAKDFKHLPEKMVIKGIDLPPVLWPTPSDDYDSGPSVVPFYIVCDEGISMEGVGIVSVNQGITDIFRVIASDPIVDEKARVGIVAFSDSAKVVLPLTKLTDVSQVPGCVAGGTSSYASVFQLLKTEITRDVDRLREEGFGVRRPYVFFLSAGVPNAEVWRRSLRELVDPSFKWRPNIVSFGVAGANPAVIKEVATPFPVGGSKKQSFAFLADHGVSPREVMKELMKFQVNS